MNGRLWTIELAINWSLKGLKLCSGNFFLPGVVKEGKNGLQLLPSKSNLLCDILSERGRCEASLKSSVLKLKGVTKKRPECPDTIL